MCAMVAGVLILGVRMSEPSREPAPGKLLSPKQPYAAGAHTAQPKPRLPQKTACIST